MTTLSQDAEHQNIEEDLNLRRKMMTAITFPIKMTLVRARALLRLRKSRSCSHRRTQTRADKFALVIHVK